jgi:sortase family protein
MGSIGRRGVAFVISAAVVAALAAPPVSALTLQRSWYAKVGTNAVYGAVSMKAYTSGPGSILYSLKGLRASATYKVAIRYGTCANLGSLAALLPSIRTSTTGTVSRVDALTAGTMYWVWKAARSPAFVIRFVSGTSIRCAGFTFVKATRVAVPSLGIDLPVIRGPSGYPLCGVAMYLPAVAQPREPGITFIYAHARSGMFLPLLTRWKIDHGASLIGKTVKVWTSNSRVVYYKINKVRVTTNAMTGVTTLTRERLWLQTSTGPNSTYPKLIVEAYRYATYSTTYSASHPTAHPFSC